MRKLKSNQTEKPIDIIELEKLCKVKLELVVDFDVDSYENRTAYPSNGYSIDASGQVIALSIKQISGDISHYINNFKFLELLNLTRTYISDISGFKHNEYLKYLYVGGNKLTDISNMSCFPNIKSLAIWDNKIIDFSPIGELKKLHELYCQRTGINDLSFLKHINKLTVLVASGNHIVDIEPLSINSSINYLDLSDNLINNIDSLCNFSNINTANLYNNKICSVSSNVAEKFEYNLSGKFDFNLRNNRRTSKKDRKPILNVGNNNLYYPPVSVLEIGGETLRKYYESSNGLGHNSLSEGRIIVIGDGSAGKSSLIEKTLYGTFEQGKLQTNGIKIEHWKLISDDNRTLTFHIWDFGGQEIQHAVHKFFFTEGCLYILVLDNRKEEEPEYWLQQIESLGGKAPVLVVFNKHDENITEIADRKFLKEKYPNILGFYNVSCKSNFGIVDFKNELIQHSKNLKTIDEQFPNNWFSIKKAIEERTSGEQHYLDYSIYKNICTSNQVNDTITQKLLLKYFTTIGAITWFGDTYINFLHVLSPAWITQGVYKIITSKFTAGFFGHINVENFNELLLPTNEKDYTYDESHFGYILGMMKKFDLCYTSDDKSLLIPSAFGKVPNVEYSEFKGENVRLYILQFKDYMPMALIHRFIAKNLAKVYDTNYWYTGIVIQDTKSTALAMIQADKEAKRIYVRIKGGKQLGIWDHIRREFTDIAASYAKIYYDELVVLDSNIENTVKYEDLISHITARKQYYFHPKLQKDFNVGYLIGLFEDQKGTLQKVKAGLLSFDNSELVSNDQVPQQILQILNNNSPTINANFETTINVDININIVNNIGSELKGEAGFLLENLEESNKALRDALKMVIQFAEDSKSAKNSGDVKEKSWGRKLKNVVLTLSKSGEALKNIQDGGEVLKSIFKGIHDLATQFNLSDILDTLSSIKDAF